MMHKQSKDTDMDIVGIALIIGILDYLYTSYNLAVCIKKINPVKQEIHNLSSAVP